ncbi:retinoic acid receptor responder (tazarotene induced) 1 S homeolog precursor [Xenopus laevis]|uniref:MGC80661 protein n=2 Tax=Xenopus laevis TaxID=8355 RepID=Q6GP58_XENLA|nr:retinoic acid receptor responder (tazarotene induced) 1 S homeolog precursor [Xenopus laevis]AAH73285.1 MGC80661 protein [Xenopus laevis]OCT78667.1 hypothetical protein XELAEV_18029752mg [Xenopus laevis]
MKLVWLITLLPLAIRAIPFSVSPEAWSVRDIPTSQRAAREAGRVTVQYLNYYSGSPHQLLYLDAVRKATVKSIPEIGDKFYIEFTTKDYQTNEARVCTASVFFRQQQAKPAIHVNCTTSGSLMKAREDDYNFYSKVKKQITPISGKDIPDSFGFIEPDMLPVWYLAIMGSSFAVWEKTTEERSYTMAQIKTVQQLPRKDDSVAFDYDILLHELPTEEMIHCSLHIVWIPGKPPKVDYECSNNAENGSGAESEEGSTFLGNFK